MSHFERLSTKKQRTRIMRCGYRRYRLPVTLHMPVTSASAATAAFYLRDGYDACVALSPPPCAVAQPHCGGPVGGGMNPKTVIATRCSPFTRTPTSAGGNGGRGCRCGNALRRGPASKAPARACGRAGGSKHVLWHRTFRPCGSTHNVRRTSAAKAVLELDER
jgi:hypothetical protein